MDETRHSPKASVCWWYLGSLLQFSYPNSTCYSLSLFHTHMQSLSRTNMGKLSNEHSQSAWVCAFAQAICGSSVHQFAFSLLCRVWVGVLNVCVCVCGCAWLIVWQGVSPLLCLRVNQRPCLSVTLTWWPFHNGTVAIQAQASPPLPPALLFSRSSSPLLIFWQPCFEASPRCQQQNLMAPFFSRSDRCLPQANDSVVIYIRARALPPLAYFHEASHK